MKKFVSPLLNRRPAAPPDEPPAKKPKLEASNKPIGSRQPTLLAPKRNPLLVLEPASTTEPTTASAEGYYNVLWCAPTTQQGTLADIMQGAKRLTGSTRLSMGMVSSRFAAVTLPCRILVAKTWAGQCSIGGSTWETLYRWERRRWR